MKNTEGVHINQVLINILKTFLSIISNRAELLKHMVEQGHRIPIGKEVICIKVHLHRSNAEVQVLILINPTDSAEVLQCVVVKIQLTFSKQEELVHLVAVNLEERTAINALACALITCNHTYRLHCVLEIGFQAVVFGSIGSLIGIDCIVRTINIGVFQLYEEQRKTLIIWLILVELHVCVINIIGVASIISCVVQCNLCWSSNIACDAPTVYVVEVITTCTHIVCSTIFEL